MDYTKVWNTARKMKLGIDFYKKLDELLIKLESEEMQCDIPVVIERFYSAMGTCGITEGVEVKGKLTKIDGWGAYLTCERRILHLCDQRTLNAL